MEFINEITLFHLIIVSYTGALIGEITRSAECSQPIKFSIFLTELLASGFLAIMIALALDGTILKKEPVAVLAAAGVFGYLDRQVCLKIIAKLNFIKLDDNQEKNNKI